MSQDKSFKQTLNDPGNEQSLVTNDTLFDGRVSCKQNVNGYRFSIDAILAAQFYRPEKGAKVLDLGAGCGVMSLIVNYRWGRFIDQIHGLEVQPSLHSLCQTNYTQNSLQGECTLGDVKDIQRYFQAEYFDLVLCNPPYYKAGSGRTSKSPEARRARHLSPGSLHDFVLGASLVLKNRGVAVFVFPADQTDELIFALDSGRLKVKQMQFSYSFPEATRASLVVMKCVKNGGPGCDILPPLYIYRQRNGSYSEEMDRYYNPER